MVNEGRVGGIHLPESALALDMRDHAIYYWRDPVVGVPINEFRFRFVM